jgi:TonB family protein
MAEIQENNNKEKKGNKQKKMNIRVDFTPMVDMNMLLITFFMLCTSLSKPQTMEISMPSNDKNITEEQQNKVKASQALTLLLAELTQAKVQISIADVKGNDELNGKDIADLQEVITQAPETQKKEEPYTMVEQMPQFPGGPAELLKYIAKNLKYPVIAQENGIQGKVILRFVVSAQGQVEDVKVIRSLDPYCDKEAIRVVKSLPQWIPGKQNGRNVPVYYTCPIVFKLQ